MKNSGIRDGITLIHPIHLKLSQGITELIKVGKLQLENSFLDRKITLKLVRILSLLFAGFAIYGSIQSFTVVPWWDMWNGYVEFIVDFDNGDYSLLWSAHGEHRILIARLFFLTDYYIFEGSLIFLIVSNFILVLLSSLIIWLFIRKIDAKHPENPMLSLPWLLSFSWLFYWVQKDNFNWGFQLQLFLAVLLPLLTFYVAAGCRFEQKNGLAVLSIILGVLSVFTMANGLLVFPLLGVFALFDKRFRLVGCMLLAVSCGVAYLYLRSGDGSGELASSVLAIRDWPGYLSYVLSYMGSPLAYMMEYSSAGRKLGQFAGVIYILALVYCIFCSSRIGNTKRQIYLQALLMFCLFILLTGWITAIGRSQLGADQALAPRYTSFSISGWIALGLSLGVILSEARKKKLNLAVKVSALLFTFLALIMGQMKAFYQDSEVYDKKLGLMTLLAGINDHVILGALWPAERTHELFPIIDKARGKNFAFLDKYGFSMLKQQALDKSVNDYPVCEGQIFAVEPLNYDVDYYRVKGMEYFRSKNADQSLILFMDEERTIVGYAFKGLQVLNAINIFQSPDALSSGFIGYIRKEFIGDEVKMVSIQDHCMKPVLVPVPNASEMINPV